MSAASITIDVEATVSGRPVRCDYGVPRSPVWTEIEGIEVSSDIYVNGKAIAKNSALYRELAALILADAHDLPADEWDEQPAAIAAE